MSTIWLDLRRPQKFPGVFLSPAVEVKSMLTAIIDGVGTRERGRCTVIRLHTQ